MQTVSHVIRSFDVAMINVTPGPSVLHCRLLQNVMLCTVQCM